MKYAALQAAKLLLLAVLAVLLWGILHADPQQADFSVLQEQTEQAMDTTGMRQADAQLLRRLYGLNGGELAGWALWTSEDNMAVEELLLAECVSEAQGEQVREALEARRSTQIQNFEGYGPEQVRLLEDSIMEVRGVYVLFVVSEQAREVKDAFLGVLYPGPAGTGNQ